MVNSGWWVNDAAKVGCLLSHASAFLSLDEAQVLDGPNYRTYNTVVDIIYVSTKIATDTLEDAETEITCGLKGL